MTPLADGVSVNTLIGVSGLLVTILLAVLAGIWQLATKLARVEQISVKELTHNGGGSMKDYARDAATNAAHLAEGVARLEDAAGEISDAQKRLDFRVNGIEQRITDQSSRITDHRRRNEQQIESLRAEVERRMNLTDEHLGRISNDLLQSETMRAALVELGLPVDRPGGEL